MRARSIFFNMKAFVKPPRYQEHGVQEEVVAFCMLCGVVVRA
jgi:hypothetical protein